LRYIELTTSYFAGAKVVNLTFILKKYNYSIKAVFIANIKLNQFIDPHLLRL